MHKYKLSSLLILSSIFLLTGCKKFLEIAPPISTLTTDEIFSNNTQAEWAIAGIYSKMINGLNPDPMYMNDIALASFSAGLSTIMGGFSADELTSPSATYSNIFSPVFENKLTVLRPGLSQELWRTAYKVIYEANVVIEGIAASDSPDLIDSVKNQITGEALALRAFSYFYLVNFFGDLPLALTSNFNHTGKLSRSPVNKIYDQIKDDLNNARSLLTDNFSVGNNERIRINKWFVEALLARVFLYTGEFQEAVNSATAVINQTNLFIIEPSLSTVFHSNSKEAIFQLKSTNEDASLRDATPEGMFMTYFLIPGVYNVPNVALSNVAASVFETGDKRKSEWTQTHESYLLPAKYKVGLMNSSHYGPQTEYYVVMRLAELYLIRAEAAVLLSAGNKDLAIDDLNVLRRRADVDELSYALTSNEVIDAVAHERRVELFAEWGHRWFDLKRTAKANTVLSNLSYKQPWVGDHQFLYPIPPDEIRYNNNLSQNPLYNL